MSKTEKYIMRILIVVFTMLFSCFLSSASAQTPEQESYLTPSMLMKISSYCQRKELMQYMFARVNDIYYSDEVDKALRTLYNHLDYAEKFLIEIYDQYGSRMGYFVLKDMGFTLYESSIVEDVWKKEEERREAVAERKRKEKEMALMKRIQANEIFLSNVLSGKPSADIDILDMATYDVVNDREELMNYSYDCIVTKDGKLLLVNPSDTLQYSAVQKFIYNYMTENSAGAFSPGYIEIDGASIPVDSYFTITFNEIRNRIQGSIRTTVKKDKKTGCWKFVDDISEQLRYFAGKDSEAMKYDLEAAINTSQDLAELKGKKEITAAVYQRIFSSNISSIVNLSFYFEMTYLKDNVWDMVQVPIKYPVAF